MGGLYLFGTGWVGCGGRGWRGVRHVRDGFRGGGFPLTSGDFCRLPRVSCVSGQGFSRVPGVLGRQRPRGGAGGRGARVCGAAVRSLTPAGSGRPPARGGDAPGRRTGHRRAVTVACVRSRAGPGWCPGSGPCAGGGGAPGPLPRGPGGRWRCPASDPGCGAPFPVPAAPCARSPAGGGGAAGGRGHPCPIPAGGGGHPYPVPAGGGGAPGRSLRATAGLRVRSRRATAVACVRSRPAEAVPGAGPCGR